METVTVTRQQFEKLKRALAHQANQCRQEAAECKRLGLEKIEAKWLRDAEEFQALCQEIWGL